jgi:uncharacterized protein (TIGR00661 family)
MKILYAIQGTGNGHLSRSLDIVPCLQKHGEVDVLVSGIQGDLPLPFEITYKLRGMSFIFGKSGGVNLWKTFQKTNIRKLMKEIKSLPVEKYDLVINDFEPVSAWACYFRNKTCISLSHQSAVLSDAFPKPDHEDRVGRLILNNYAPGTVSYGFHFRPANNNIFTPVIRKQVREQEVEDKGHYTVYLPSYDDKKLIKRLSAFKNVKWDVFSKHNKKVLHVYNMTIQPIDGEMFIKSMAASSGVLCGAGFETPAEALYLGKKLMVIPMKNQYEQHLNAAVLRSMGIPVIKSLKKKHEDAIQEWFNSDNVIKVDYPDETQQIVDAIISKYSQPLNVELI